MPAYNEEEMLETAVAEATAAGEANFTEFEILIVDDGSTDRTAQIADRLGSEQERIRVVHHAHNRGFSGAMLSCVQNAVGQYVFMGPADGQANFQDVARFWALVDRYDLIFSYRQHRGDAAGRKAASTLWYLFIRVMLGTRIPEFSSLFCFRRDSIPQFVVPIRPDASNFLPVLYLTAVRQRLRVGTIGIDHGPRRGGTAKGGNVANALRTIVEDLILCWRLRIRPRR
ncbi:MAG TPA: glycosyltransferase family 2 protein [Solirubrobacteraceae bacterium]|jgi:glycosyltransferase involved in cell wall biosynthesis